MSAKEKILETLKNTTLPDPSECEGMIDTIQWIVNKEEELRISSENYKKLKGIENVKIPAVLEIESLVSTVEELGRWCEEVNQLTKAVESHQTVIDAIDIEAIIGLQSDAEIQQLMFADIKIMEEEFLSIATTAKATRDELKTITEEHAQKQKEKDAKKVCPLCERPL